MKVVLDTNCLLDAADANAKAHRLLQKLLAAGAAGMVHLAVSCHSLSELSKDEPVTQLAREVASRLTVIPNYPIGTWDNQIATWDQLGGTWEDAQKNQDLRIELESLAKARSDIRDRGAYIDALRAGADVFVTSDRQLAGSGPASRLQQRFRLRVLTPAALASELDL